jgi:hypothetical protein
MCFTLGASIAEIVSAFPTCGGLYSASALLVPRRHRARVRVNSSPFNFSFPSPILPSQIPGLFLQNEHRVLRITRTGCTNGLPPNEHRSAMS